MMRVQPIRSEADYDEALQEIAIYFEREPERGSAEADRFDVLAALMKVYEDEHWPVEAAHPLAAIRTVMEMRGYTQADLAKVLGSRSRASEVLNRKRHLTLEMAWALNRSEGFPRKASFGPIGSDPSASTAAPHERTKLLEWHNIYWNKTKTLYLGTNRVRWLSQSPKGRAGQPRVASAGSDME
jgi:HTH-type transcriptional regulator/antitoxin HigA